MKGVAAARDAAAVRDVAVVHGDVRVPFHAHAHVYHDVLRAADARDHVVDADENGHGVAAGGDVA